MNAGQEYAHLISKLNNVDLEHPEMLHCEGDFNEGVKHLKEQVIDFINDNPTASHKEIIEFINNFN